MMKKKVERYFEIQSDKFGIGLEFPTGLEIVIDGSEYHNESN